jgi:Flp pilus assembly protein CpaB
MTYRIRNVVIAVGLALVAMMLTLFYVTNYKRSVQKESHNVQVYVAARDITTGTSGADIVKSHQLKLVLVQRKDVVPGAISNPDQLSNLISTGPLYAGEQVTVRRFSDVTAQGIRSQLKGTMRAVQVSGDPTQLLGGTLQTGDHVDLVANLHLTNQSAGAATRIVLRDLTVLATPSSGTKAVSDAATGTNTAILAVSDTQVQRLFFVLKNADWTLELRPVVNAADSRERIDTLNTVLGEGR